MTTQNTTPEAPAAANAAPANAATTLPEDDFDAVFAEITKDTSDAKPAAKPAGDAAGADATDGGDAVATDSPDAAVAAAEAAAAGANEPAAGAAADAGKPAEADPAAELAAAQARIAELEAAVKPKDEKPAAAAAPAAATPKEPQIEWYKPTEEEAAALTAYEKEWPEISAAEQIRTKAAVYNAVQYTIAQVTKMYGPTIQRLTEVTEEVESFMALSELRGAHKDYDNIRENVVQWVSTLPGPFKKAGQATLESGTPDEVSELIAEYKKANPTKPVVVATAGAAAPAAKGKTEGISAAAKKAAVALSAVDSKRTSQQAAADPNDFDGAWEEATANGR